MNIPKVSIILVNYNGKAYLGECFSSIFNLEFPRQKYEVIMVDNDSKDTSVKFVRDNFPQVQILESDKNLGFAGGCNLGVDFAKGEYVVLLNIDTKVEKRWLNFLVGRLEADDKTVAVNSKILLYFPFVELSITSDVYMRSEFTNSVNFQPVGVLVENVLLNYPALQNLVRYRKGFYDKEKGIIPARWTKGEATILIPCDPRIESLNLTMTIRSEKSSSNLKTKIVVKIEDQELISDNLKSYEVKQYSITLKTEDIKRHFLYAVQNSGVAVFKNGYGRDRGAVVKDKTQFYEIDNSFYDNPVEVNAFCGASVIIRKKLYKKVGGFDESYFMYYEDVDLSLRFKRMGYEILYEPKSVVYHIHSASSVEWSPLFVYNVEKNRLATLLKHFPLKVFIIELFWYLVLWGSSVLKVIKWRLREHWELYDEWKEKLECRTSVLGWILMNFLPIFKKRMKLNSQDKKSLGRVYKTLY